MSISQVQFLLVCFLSVLLDVFGAFFVSLIGEENRFRRSWLWQQAREQTLARQAEAATMVPAVVARPEPEPEVVAQVRSALESGELKCSKRRVAEALSLSLEEVDRVFQHLLAQGCWDRAATATTTSARRGVDHQATAGWPLLPCGAVLVGQHHHQAEEGGQPAADADDPVKALGPCLSGMRK